MSQPDITNLLGVLALALASAKVMDVLARRVGVPPLLGELLAGCLLGNSVFGLIDAENRALHPVVEIGFVIFLFHVGLELDVRRFMEAVRPATAVAIVGTILPLLLGYLACRSVGLTSQVALGAGAVITATSLGVTARVLSDLNRLNDPESQVIIWGAMLGNTLGLLLLNIVGDLAGGANVTLASVALNSGLTYGFVLVVLLVGRYTMHLVFRAVELFEAPGLQTAVAVAVALALAWLSAQAGAPSGVGAVLAGLLIGPLPQGERIRRHVLPLEEVFVSIAFVCLGAVIDFRALNPFEASSRPVLMTGILLTVAATGGKFLAGYAPFWFRGNKRVIGVGMVPHGEIGLLYAQFALLSGVFDRSMFSAAALAAIVTTFLGILALQASFPLRPPPEQALAKKNESAQVRQPGRAQ